MRVHIPVFGDGTRAIYQNPLRQLQGKDEQRRWIVLAARDSTFDLGAYELPHISEGDEVDSVVNLPYSRFWEALSGLALDRKKWWLVGFRMRYAFEKAGFAQALEQDVIQIPANGRAKNRSRHTGKLTYNSRLVEVDFSIGGSKLKALDFGNFGVEPGDDLLSIDALNLEYVREALE